MLTRLWIWLLSRMGFDPRGIYVFYDGRRWRRIDPLATFLRLYDVPGFDPEAAIGSLEELASQPVPRLRRLAEIAIAVRAAFDVRPLGAGGLTDVECSDLLADFLEYTDGLKKSTEPSPIWHPSTDSLPLDVSPTQAAAHFGSTLPDPGGEPANPSDSES